jgi:predicted flap endonuclease-1-like 5' DNA nuclease
VTKSDRIRQLDRHGIFTPREIAQIVRNEMRGPCSEAYVRGVIGRDQRSANTRRRGDRTDTPTPA